MTYSSNPFFLRAQRAPKLDRQTERELFQRYRSSSDLAARDRLVECSLRCVVGVALKFSRYGVAVDVLFAEGNMGLVRALEKYDLDEDVRFATYATYWVRAHVVDYILKSWSLVGGGSGALKTRNFFRLKRETARVFGLHGDGEEAWLALSQRLELPPLKLRELVQQIEERDVSLSAPIHPGSTITALDALRASGEEQDLQLARKQVLAFLAPACEQALSELDERERFIVDKRLSAPAEEVLPLSAIADILGISRERVRQLETRAKNKLRASLSKVYGETEGVAA